MNFDSQVLSSATSGGKKHFEHLNLLTPSDFFAGELHQDPDGAPCVPPGLCHGPHLQDWRTREVRWDTYSQWCGSGMFIPDPDFYPSQISDPGSNKSNKKRGRGKNYLICNKHKFHKWKIILFFNRYRKVKANWQRIIVLFTQKIVT